jgi:arylsulfatase A-like enzyme
MLSSRPDPVRAWDPLSADEKELYEIEMETFAGILTYTDECIGRLIKTIEELGELENTIIVVISDNGASGEG